MQDSGQPTKHVISTDLPGLELVELSLNDARDYFGLVERNREHLTQYGDYMDLGQATLDTVVAALGDPIDENAKFGIRLNGVLIGRVDLSPRASGHFVIGYWLGSEYTGNGFATRACRALIEFGRDSLEATDIFAGVTKGNVRSEALLGRLGFERIEDRGSYRLFRLVVGGGDQRGQ